MLKEAALSHNDLCDAIGVGGSTVDQWVAGKTVPSALVLDDVCRFLDCTLEDIYPRNDK